MTRPTPEQIRAFHAELVARRDPTDMRYACIRALATGKSARIRRSRESALEVVAAALARQAVRS